MLKCDFKIPSKVSNDPSGKPPSTGLFVGCFIDVATGVVRYSISMPRLKPENFISFLWQLHLRGQRDQAAVQDGARHQALPQRLPQSLQQRCFAGQREKRPQICKNKTLKKILVLNQNNFQFELGRTQTTLPLSAAVMVNSGKHIVPQFPQRLKVKFACFFKTQLPQR